VNSLSNYIRWILPVWICLGHVSLPGQGAVGVTLGISNYQGDLASFSTQNGFQALIGPVFGLHGSIEKTDYFQFRGDLLFCRLAGDDALNERENTRSRNLNFHSPVIQLAAGVDWNVLGFSQDHPKDFSPYISVGASLFYFNPYARYEGRNVALRPLGTEGQFLDEYPEQTPYSPIQPSVQIGSGLKFVAGPKLIISIEAMMSWCFTDYLDDVSTIYITYPELLAKAGPLTAALANRQGEYLGTEPVVVPTGTPRANSQSKDYFGIICVKACVPFDIQSEFRIRRHNRKRIHCPKF
jgi:hypothetical protein